MKVLVTGQKGYIGSVLVPMLQAADVDVTGLDSELFGACTFGEVPPDAPSLRIDVRDVETARTFRPTIRDTRKEFWEPVAPPVPVKTV